MRSEGLYSDADCKNVLQYSTFLDGSEGLTTTETTELFVEHQHAFTW